MNKTSGIYKMYIDQEQDDWKINPCYIGISKNIENRWKTHKCATNAMLKNKDDLLLESLKFHVIIDPRKSSYLKISMYLINHNLTVSDLDFKIINKISFEKVTEIEPQEQELIDKYNIEWTGWNGIFAKQHKYKGVLQNPFITEEDQLYYQNLLEEDQKRISNVIDKNSNLPHSPYIDWLLGEQIPQTNEKGIKLYEQAEQKRWADYCDLTYENYKEWWAEHQFEYMTKNELKTWLKANKKIAININRLTQPQLLKLINDKEK